MKKEKPKTESVPEEGVQHRGLTVERAFGSQDLIELVADYIAEKITKNVSGRTVDIVAENVL